jgi:hypothetical protein
MPDSYADYYYVKVSARAEIGGQLVPVSSFQMMYALDTIPTAHIDIPIGRDAKLPGRVSSGHGILTDLLPFTPVKLYMTADAQPSGRAAPSGKDPGFGTKEMLVFEGFAGGPAVVKEAGGSAALSVDCFGMPGALSGASRASSGVTIARAINGSEVAVTRFGRTEVLVSVHGEILSNPALAVSAEDDLWNNGIFQLFDNAVAHVDSWLGEAGGFAEQAIDRINSGKGDLPVPLLSLSQFSGTGTTLRQRVARHLVTEFYDMWSAPSSGVSASLWDVLVRYTLGFLFHFVPAADADAIAPITFNLGGEPHRTLDPSEYSSVSGSARSLDSAFSSYVTSVGLLMHGWQAMGNWQDASARAFILGRAVLPNLGESKGRFLLVKAPLWLVPVALPGQNTLLPGEGIPDSAFLGTAGDVPDQAPSETEEEAFNSDGGDAYSAAVLHEMVFRHREMAIAGRLRLDIAPGSLIRVNTPGERFSGLGDVLFGCVNKVMIEMGNTGQDSFARTSFNVVCVRSEAEHEKHTTPEHPLFQEVWRGGRLLKY